MKDRTVIAEYLKNVIEELEDELIDSINKSQQITKQAEKHRQNILTFKSFIKDESYTPLYFIEECKQFNELREKEVKAHVDNFTTINRIASLKSNLSWFDGSKNDE